MTALMTWNKAQKRWFKKYAKKQYVVSCKELGTAATKEASLAAANSWWTAKQAELEQEAAASRPNVAEWKAAINLARLQMRWIARHSTSPDLMTLYNQSFPGQDLSALDDVHTRLSEKLGQFIKLAEEQIASGDDLEELPEYMTQPTGPWVDRLAFSQGEAEARQLGDLIEEWIDEKRALAQAGQIATDRFQKYKYCIEHFLGWMGADKSPKSLDSLSLSEYHRLILKLIGEGKCSTAYGKERMDTAKQFARWLYERDVIDLPKVVLSKTALKIKLAKKTPKTTKPNIVATLVNDGRVPDATKLYVLLMANCGMYPVDVARLERSQVNLAKGLIRRKRSKTEGHERVPTVTYNLWPQTLELLKKQMATEGRWALLNRDGGRLQKKFVGADGKAKKVCNITVAVRRAAEKLKTKLSVSTLRKTSANLIFNNPKYQPLHTLFLGHAPRTVAELHYVTAGPQMLRKAIKWLGLKYGLIQRPKTK